jgi:hypothetical protein
MNVWDMAQCSLVELDKRFRGAYCLHHQGDQSRSMIVNSRQRLEDITFQRKCDISSILRAVLLCLGSYESSC